MTSFFSTARAMTPRRTWPVAILAAALAFTAMIYAPGLGGPLVFDDYQNIAENKALLAAADDPATLWQAVITAKAGPMKRPLSVLSFAANLATGGQAVRSFKITNLAIHLLNGVLVFALVRAILLAARGRPGEVPAGSGGAAVALATAAVWLVHPAQLTSVLYVVQRMNSLSATFLLAGLLLYCRLRAGSLDAGRGRWSLWLGVPALALLSVLSKENGVLLFAFAFVLEFCLFDFRCARAATRRELLRWHLAFVALPVVAAVAWVVLTVDFSGAPFPHRTFSAVERLLTETRVLWGYVAALFVPRPPDLALYYDDIVISRGLLSPPSTLFALLGALGLCAFALLARRRFPWFAFAVLWFLAGHLIESTVLPLEIAHLHRNYVPYIGPIAAAVVAVHQALQRRRPGLSRLAALAVVAGLGALTAQRADQWSDPFSLAMYEVAHRPESSRANYEAGRMYFIAYRASPTPELFDSARRAFERAMELDRDSIGPSIALLILRGGPNYIADDPVLGALRERLARRPLNPPEVHYLRSLIECQARPDCARPPNDMLEIFASALESPHTLPGPKADLLALMGLYYADALNDLPACIRTMRESVKMAPRDPNYRLNLAQALMVAGDWAAAEEALDEAETLDRLRAYAGRITALRADLAAMTAADG